MQPIPHTLTIDITYPISLDYIIYLPEGYTPDETYPVLVYLHGAGERDDSLGKVRKTGIPAKIEAGEDLPFIVIAPQCPENHTWQTLTIDVIFLLDSILANYSADPNRVYITGYSMGGYGTWDLLRLYPEKFAAAAPICGGLNWLIDLDTTVAVIKTTPIWTFHGEKDDAVPISETQRLVDALQAVDGDIKFTIYPDGEHDVWTETYDNPELYEWFLAHSLGED